MERLPNELLFIIGKHTMDRWRPAKTLCSLTLCSRRLHSVFQPLLLYHITPNWSIHIVHLIIRLWRHPELARKVRHLVTSWLDCDGGPCKGLGEDETVGDDVVEFVDAALDEILEAEEADTRTKWKEHLLIPCEEAWLGLLLVRTTHLETIEFSHGSTELMADILRKAARRQRPFHRTSPFPHLQEVFVSSQTADTWVDSAFLQPFFYFPAVRKIDGGPVGESYRDGTETWSRDIRHSSRPVREVTVRPAWWCRGMLDWLAASPALEHVALVFGLHRDEDHLPEKCKFHAPEFRHALLPFTRTLRTLHLQVEDPFEENWRSVTNDRRPFGSLREFAVLDELRMRWVHLLQAPPARISRFCGNKTRSLVEILPASLRRLDVLELEEHYYIDLLLQLSRLVQHRTSFPRLRRVGVYVKEVDGDLRSALQQEFAYTGIDVTVEVQESRW
ncbi:hypothetical protein BO82DRAFT_423649 [Aspergillus uvarum CBS 121591]|uniref:Leucine-rich repeat domain-containing protein n=1 Tax=Aspergillus uvarum CBS 121591 TaxID=1448315 RepID=A0A319CPK4_9EURO|nr:hypothetical protein BO82DRAFT_423649 [Aspergillus uvarum CBS 121591]PYH77428.1 hypothetical protein BO82DRAFT_423649 [Aspergillus uvarum CBS 121591]